MHIILKTRYHNITSPFELFSVLFKRLMIAVSYNLWSFADHRCWLVGWGAFLIKRLMSGEGILTLWHYKRWHHFKILCLLCCPMRPRGGKKQCKEEYTPPELLSMTGGTIITFLSTFCSYICAAKMGFEVRKGERMLGVWEMQHNEG